MIYVVNISDVFILLLSRLPLSGFDVLLYYFNKPKPDYYLMFAISDE